MEKRGYAYYSLSPVQPFLAYYESCPFRPLAGIYQCQASRDHDLPVRFDTSCKLMQRRFYRTAGRSRAEEGAG